MKIHEFMVNTDGELSESAKALPTIREHLEKIPKTKAFFRLSHVDEEITVSRIRPRVMEFLGAWEVPDWCDRRSSNKTGKRYVNPNYVHAPMYTDLRRECSCGAVITRSFQENATGIERENVHDDETCFVCQRRRLKKEIREESYKEIVRLAKLGWRAKEIGNRLACSEKVVKYTLYKNDLTIIDLREEFHRKAANTYTFLVNARNVDRGKVAGAYGIAPSHIRKWRREYDLCGPCEYDIEVAQADRFTYPDSKVVRVR